MSSASDLLVRHPQAGHASGSAQERELIVAGTPYILIYRTSGQRINVLHGARARRR